MPDDTEKKEVSLPLDPKVAMMMTRRETNPLNSRADRSPLRSCFSITRTACGCNELVEALAQMIVYMEQCYPGNVLLIQGALRSVRTYYGKGVEDEAEMVVNQVRGKYI